MDSVEIVSEILKGIKKALELGYDKHYVNVDDLETGFGFLRVLAMKGFKGMIVYEDTIRLEVCYQVLELLQESEYDITDFTSKWCDD